MRAIWSGAITFSLVNVPVKIYSATQDHDLDLHQVHRADGGKIRYQRRCETCGKVIAYKDIDKAFTRDGETVILTDDDIKTLPEEQNHEIDVVEFVPNHQIDPIRFDRSYFLEPTSKSTKAYTLLRRILERTERTAVAQFSLRQRTRLAVLRVYDSTILLQTLLWDDEVRQVDFPALEHPPRISAKELDLAQQIVAAMETDFEPKKFSDNYQVQLKALVEEKLQSGDAVAATTPESESEGSSGEVIDLKDALRKSIAKNRAGTDDTQKRKTKTSRTPKKTSSPQRKPASFQIIPVGGSMDWNTVFYPSVPLLELFMRGSVIYLAVFAMMRVVGNREAGEVNTADLIVIVIISEAASAGLGGDASSILDGVVLVATVLMWSIFLDALGYFVPAVRVFLKPKVQALIRDGELQRRTMRRELMTVEEVDTQLRMNGITDIAEVHLAFVEPNGAISVIKRRSSPTR